MFLVALLAVLSLSCRYSLQADEFARAHKIHGLEEEEEEAARASFTARMWSSTACPKEIIFSTVPPFFTGIFQT